MSHDRFLSLEKYGDGQPVGHSTVIMNYSLLILLFFSRFVKSQQTTCNENEFIKPTREYNFHWNYKGLYVRTWCFSTDKGAALTLECPVVQMQKFTGRCRDTLNVTVTGNLRDGRVFCDPFKVEGNSVIMKLFSIDGQGYFNCKVKAELVPSCNCGYSGDGGGLKITQGTPAGTHEFTSFGGLIDVYAREVRCGATLINNRLALTAAHCVVNGETLAILQAGSFGLLVGDYDLSKGNDSSSSHIYRIKRFVPKPGFNFENNRSSDIALIETFDVMRFDRYVGPACLPYKFSGFLYEKKAIIAGWGHTEFGGSMSDVLLKAVVDIEYPFFCEQVDAYKSTYSEENMICTYGYGADSCQHDSGGPLYYKDPDTGALFLIGIISLGIGCGGNYPSISIRVYSYLEWIHETYPGESFCIK